MPEDNGARPARDALQALEAAVAKALSSLASASGRARAAEAKSAELAEVVRRFTGNPEEAGRLLSRIERLEAENMDLRDRLQEGRAGVERLLAKIRFLENQR